LGDWLDPTPCLLKKKLWWREDNIYAAPARGVK
jgi:hypothetical protein